LVTLNKHINLTILNFIQSFDIIFSNSINFTTLIFAIILCFGFVIFLLTQANLLNLSFYPNATFDSEKYSPYECGFAPFRTE
jgi:NADH:ubiquinone oxidoreductase subunit 3 (subunit A)